MSTNQYKCVIIDDEPTAIDMLADSLSIVNKKVSITEIFSSWPEALEGLRSLDCDILFLDISINGRNAMDLLRMVPDLRCEIIFVTAYSDHAVDAFRFPSSGYLLKPVDDVELALALDRAIERVENKKQTARTKSLLHTRIAIPDSRSTTYLSMEDILLLEAVKAYTRVVTLDAEILSAYNLGKFRELLPEDLFYQVHRSFLVNLNRVRRYENAGFLVLENGMEIPVSRTARAGLLALFARVRPGEGR